VEWDVILASEGSLARLTERPQDMGCKVKIWKVFRVEDDAAMTRR
jgi:hypothetical protein